MQVINEEIPEVWGSCSTFSFARMYHGSIIMKTLAKARITSADSIVSSFVVVCVLLLQKQQNLTVIIQPSSGNFNSTKGLFSMIESEGNKDIKAQRRTK